MLFSIDDQARRKQPALIDAATEVAWTYDELAEEVGKRRDALVDSQKRLVFLFCRNDLNSVARYLASV